MSAELASGSVRTDMEMCLCSKCPHIYIVIRNEVNKDVPLSYSLTEFLSKDMKCMKETEIGFHSLNKCILGTCENKCKVVEVAEEIKCENHEDRLIPCV